jgi:type II restriction enzyme
MADSSFYLAHYGINSADAAFEHFKGTLQNYYDADFYVGWDKIYERIEYYRSELFLLSSLCGVQDKQAAARRLLAEYPKVIAVLPLLMARRKTVQLLEERSKAQVTTYNFPQKLRKLSEAEIEHYINFLCTSRVLELLDHIKSVPDYVTGVEVGMDTNARKNRGGACGVKAIQPFVNEALIKLSFLQAKAEANFDFLSRQGCILPESFSNERWDWAFWLKDNPRRFAVMEVNHYGSSGSKLKAIARDYIGRHKALETAGIGFIWVTDGQGWLKSHRALREAFDTIKHLINIRLAQDGQLEWALRNLLSVARKSREEHAA